MPDHDKLKQFLQLMSDSLTKTDFENKFKLVFDVLKKAIETLDKKYQETLNKIDQKTQEAVDTLEGLQQKHAETIKRIETDNASTVSNLKKWVLLKVGELFIKSAINEKIAEIDDKLVELNNYQPKDGAIGPVGPQGEPGSPDTPEMVRDKLETLKGGERLKIETIDKLQDILEELKNRPVSIGGGGGFSLLSYLQHIVDNEVPSGTPNGVLTTFTLVSIPSPSTSLKVFVNGQRLKLTEDYTLSGNTITFVIAPPTNSLLLCDYKT